MAFKPGDLEAILGADANLLRIFGEMLEEQKRGAWKNQPPECRHQRMSFVLRMGAECAVIRQKTMQATAWCEWCIEGVITGEAHQIRLWANAMTFEGHMRQHQDEGDHRRLVQLFTRFKDLALEAADYLEFVEPMERNRYESGTDPQKPTES